MVVGNYRLRSHRCFFFFFFWGGGGQILSDLITCLAIRDEAIPTLAVVNKNGLVSNHS